MVEGTVLMSCRLPKGVDNLDDSDVGAQVEDDLKQGGAKSQEVGVTSVDEPTTWNLRNIVIIIRTLLSSVQFRGWQVGDEVENVLTEPGVESFNL